MMDFVKDLHEARMTRNSQNQKVLTYNDCCERMYLIMLVLEVLTKFADFRGKAQSYARLTAKYEGYNIFRMSATDLYNFIYFITGDDTALDKLKDPGAAKKIRQTTRFPTMQANAYITRLANGGVTKNAAELMIKLEGALNINNAEYKAVRRIVTNFDKASTVEKKNAISRLLIASRAKLRSSDIIDEFEKLAALKDLESARVNDTEPTLSKPDIAVTGSDLAYYRYIVGQDNLMLTKKFLELAAERRSMPSQYVGAYLPAIQMIDDIVKAGPSYISMLRAVHTRAKRHLKK